MLQKISETAKPPPDRTPDQWANQNRVLPRTKSEPGQWVSETRPYTIGPMRAAVDPRYRIICFVTASQMGKTAAALNVIGYTIDDRPGPILYLGPTRNNVNTVIEPELIAMLKSVPHLWEKTDTSREANKLARKVGGVMIRLGWTGSATEVASMSAVLVVLDELDRMKDIPNEGDPKGAAKARLSDYPDGKMYVDATPTLGQTKTVKDPVNGLEFWSGDADEIESPTWLTFLEGTQKHWSVPCIACDEYFIPRFSLLKWTSKDKQGKPLSNAAKAKTAALACPHCGFLHEDKYRIKLLSAGLYIAPGQQIVDGKVIGDAPESDTDSYWCSGLMSRKVSFNERCMDWLKAVDSGKPGSIQMVINTAFAELYSFSGEAPEWEMVAACKGGYKQETLPAGVQKLFITVDVGKNYLQCSIRGWAYGSISYGISAFTLYGNDTEDQDDPVWDELQEYRYHTIDGMPIEACGLDCGYNTQTCYLFVLKNRGWCKATKGASKPTRPYMGAHVQKKQNGKTDRNGVYLWSLNSSHYKSKVYDMLPNDTDAKTLQKLRWRISDDHSEEYCKQVVGESRIQSPSGLTIWKRIAENHWLDCEAMQFFLADLLKVNLLKPLTDQQPKPDSTKKTGTRMVSIGN